MIWPSYSDASIEVFAELNALVDLAAAAALASGIPVGEMWLERQTDRIETRLMRDAGGPPAVGELSRGEVVARIWLDGSTVNYEGIKIGAGWTCRRAEA